MRDWIRYLLVVILIVLMSFFLSISKLFVNRDVLTKSEIDLGLQLAILNFFNIFFTYAL